MIDRLRLLLRRLGLWRCRRGHHRYRAVIKFIYSEPYRFHWHGGYERWTGLECSRCQHRALGISVGDVIPVPLPPERSDMVYERAQAWAAGR